MDTNLPWFLRDGNSAIRTFKESKSFLILDFETTIKPGFATNQDNHIVLACYYVVRNGTLTKKWHFGDEYDQQELVKDVEAADFVVAHNAKFEAQWLKRCGVDLHNLLVFCTMVGEWVLLGNNPGRLSTSLDDVAKRRLGRTKDKLGSNLIRRWGVCPSVTPRTWLVRYCMDDVDLTYRIFLQQRQELGPLGLWHIALSRNLTIPALADIELQGLQLDVAAVKAEYAKQLEIRETIAQELDAITGGINLNSTQQVTKLLFDKLGFAPPKDAAGRPIVTPKGLPSASEEAISRLVAITPDQKKFVELYKKYNKATTLLTKNLNFFNRVVECFNGVFYGTILHGRTGTHRLASGGVDVLFPGDKATSKAPQLQNVPRQYKKLFVAHDADYVVLESDGAQLEFRVAGDLGNDVAVLMDIEGGVDIHAFTREVMRAAHHPDFVGLDDKEARQEAKGHTFQPLYFGRGSHPAEQAYATAWAKKYPDLYRTQKDWCYRVADTKMLVTPYGMRFYWPRAELQRGDRVNVQTEVANYPIQGLATAEIIPIALVHFWHRTKHLRISIFNTVHDSIISRVHKDDAEDAKLASKVALTTDVYNFLREVYGYEFSIPLGVGCHQGKYWGDGKEQIWEVWPDGREKYTEKE